MAMVGVDSGSLYRRTHSLSRLAWSWVGGHLKNEPVELSQWLCHDYSTINIVLVIIIINQPPWSTQPGHPSVGRCIEYQIRLGR